MGDPAALRDFVSASRRAYHWSRESALSRLRALAWQWVGIVVALIAAMGLFAKIGEDVFEHESRAFDGAVRSWTLAHQTVLGRRVFIAITLSCGTGPMVALAAVVALWLWRARGRHVAAAVVAAATVSTACFVAVKEIFARTRPIGAAAFLHRVTYSFPSGHATSSAAVLGTIAYVLWRERLVSARVVAWGAAVAVLLIGLSRVYLDLHWATDVLGGWCLGFGVAAASAALYERWRSRIARGDDRGRTAEVTHGT